MISAFWGVSLYSESWGHWSSSNPFAGLYYLDYQADGFGEESGWSLCWADHTFSEGWIE